MFSLVRDNIAQLFEKKAANSLVLSDLQNHDELGKQHAVDAVNILIKYKKTVHEFTEDIIDFWPLPKRVMTRYQLDNAEQLNEWLDDLS